MTKTPIEVLGEMEGALRREGFLPYEKIKLGKRMSTGITLHESMRSALSMKPDDSLYMYWEWSQLKPAIDSLWTALDVAASKIEGRTTSSVAFAGRENSTLSDVCRMIEAVDTSNLLIFPIAHRRPVHSESQVRFVGKFLGACLQTLGILVSNSESEYGELFSELAKTPLSNEELLAFLDEKCGSLGKDLSSLSKPKSPVILRALGFALQVTNEARDFEDLAELSLSQFLIETDATDPWINFSDVSVLKRLLEIAPEKSMTGLASIKKFLSE